MASPYTTVTVTGYNDNPPVDDGTESEENRVLWETIKEKLPDPLKTAIEAVNTNVIAAFLKVIGGGGVTSSAISATIGAGDQGKLYRATGAGITITTPDATSVTSPWVCGFVNNASSSVTLDGNGSQTVNGSASLSIPVGGGGLLFTDGSNWFIVGLGGVPVGKELGYGVIVNGTIAEANATNAATFSLKTLAGADPSTADPVLICFRNATAGTGNYVYRTVTAALTLTLSSGSTLGASNASPFRIWLVLFDDGGTIRMGAIKCRSGTNIYPLGRTPIASSTAEGGAGGADADHVFYTGTAVTSKPYVILGYATYESGLVTAGSWNASPTTLQLYGPGVPLPGTELQFQGNTTGAVATGTTTTNNDDTIPQNNEGDEYMTQAITPVSAANVLEVSAQGHFANSSDIKIAMSLFQDTTADALSSIDSPNGGAANIVALYGPLVHRMLAGTTSATTFKIRAGAFSAGTTTFNGTGGARRLGGVLNSFLRVRELMA